MEINPRFISLPPFLSVAWHQVASIHMEEDLLIFTLISGGSIELANLPQEVIQRIFNVHCFYMRNTPAAVVRPQQQHSLQKDAPQSSSQTNSALAEPPAADIPEIGGIRLGFTTLDGMGSALQHNPTMADAPDIPHDILNKIAAVTKILAPDESEVVPKAEPNCNCMHCQIVRTIHSELKGVPAKGFEDKQESIVHDEELTFQEWEIKQEADQLFTVIRRLEPKEQYQVFLGQPIGCTCGKEGCEHIVAVLQS